MRIYVYHHSYTPVIKPHHVAHIELGYSCRKTREMYGSRLSKLLSSIYSATCKGAFLPVNPIRHHGIKYIRNGDYFAVGMNGITL